jgi:GntR family transcriptional repressor for pyruvate dehydrogenase complex
MLQFESIPVTRLHSIVVKALEERILAGDIKPGELLPTEKDLADQLKVGRRAVREALRILQIKGLIESRMGIGAIVLRNDLDNYLDTLTINMHSYLDTNKGELENVLEFREIIESAALRRLVSSSTAEVVQRFRENLREQTAAQERNDPEAYAACHMAFHKLIVAGLDNAIVSMVYDNVRKLIAPRVFKAGRTPEQQRRSIAEHSSIVDAVERRDQAACDAALKQHLALAYENLRMQG